MECKETRQKHLESLKHGYDTSNYLYLQLGLQSGRCSSLKSIFICFSHAFFWTYLDFVMTLLSRCHVTISYMNRILSYPFFLVFVTILSDFQVILSYPFMFLTFEKTKNEKQQQTSPQSIVFFSILLCLKVVLVHVPQHLSVTR